MATERALSAHQYLDRFRELETEKQPWLIHYEALAEILLTRKMYFTRVMVPGQFLQADVFDNTAQFAAGLFGSVCLSMMWPDASRTFSIEPVEELKGLPGVEKYFRWVTKQMHRALDNPKAGVQTALAEHFLDQGIFGTSGIAVMEGPDDDPSCPVVWDSWGVKSMCLAETAEGRVDTVYYRKSFTVRQLVLEYSKPGDKIPPKVQELYDARKFTDRIDVLVVIEPKKADKTKSGQAAMSVRTVHIAEEYGYKMREGAFEEMFVFVGRMYKSIDEVYGRSPGMIALPDAQSLNALTEAVLVAAEKQLDPPLGLLDSGRLGGGVVDTSASALTVFNSSGRMGDEKPIFPLYTVGELNSAKDQQDQLKGKIMSAYLLDRLLDLNNNTQMTAYETSVRDRKTSQAVGGIFSRQETEVLTPAIERTFNVQFRKGYLGLVNEGPGAELRKKWAKVKGGVQMVVPQAVVEAYKLGLDVFEVKYISPAKRFQQAEKLQGLMTAGDTLAAMAPVLPGVMDNVDADDYAHQVFTLNGAPMSPLRTKDDLIKFRAANRAEKQQQDEMAQKEQTSNTALKNAQARLALSNARPGA